MKKKNIIFLILISLVLILLSVYLIRDNNLSVLGNQGDSNIKNTFTNEPLKVNSVTPLAEDVEKEDDNITQTPTNTLEPFVGRMDLDNETENFFYGTWEVEKLLGFANSYNDASEYPNGQKVIGDEIIINKDFFSSKGLENYSDYQYGIKDPLYNIKVICYNEDSFYRLFKTELPDLNIDDEVKYIVISLPTSGLGIPVSFLVVNNDRLILSLEATIFELKRVIDLMN